MAFDRPLHWPALATLGFLLFTPAAHADTLSEHFVAAQAGEVLSLLNDRSLLDAARAQQFSDRIHALAYLPDIARRVLGVQGRTLSAAEFDRYYRSFDRYATAVYRARLQEFSGASVRIVGSTDLSPRNSHVTTMIMSTDTGKEIEVVWDVLTSQDRTSQRVRDVGINLGGSLIWLAQDQQAQFEAFMDRNNGDIDKLIARIDQKTADLDGNVTSSSMSTLTRAARSLDTR
jgi:phospholipid transport system substrate-binding protein